MLPNSFYDASITQIPSQIMTTIKNCSPFSLIHIDAKFLNKIVSNHFQQYIKILYTKIKLVSFQGCKNGSNQ
jgi:hypothetical protein